MRARVECFDSYALSDGVPLEVDGGKISLQGRMLEYCI